MLCAARCVQHAEVSLLMALADGGAHGSFVFRSFSIFLSIASSMSPNPRPSESYTRMCQVGRARGSTRAQPFSSASHSAASLLSALRP